jgi:hypothetical protein
MQVGDFAKLEWEVGIPHRPGAVQHKRLVNRTPPLDGPDTFNGLEVVASRCIADKTTPRHRHNFDQFRIGLGGLWDEGISKRHKLVNRTIMYVPAGTWYGPHSSHNPPDGEQTFLAALQFDGECMGGYIDFARADAASHDLRNHGTFKDGFFYPDKPNGKKAQDAFEAAWEHATGKQIVYPPSFVDAPIYMHIDALPWAESETAGVQQKLLGAWGNHGLRLGMSLLAAGASRTHGGKAQSHVTFVLSGDALLDGKPLSRYSAVLLEPGETATFAGTGEGTELIEIALPNFARAAHARRKIPVAARSLTSA